MNVLEIPLATEPIQRGRFRVYPVGDIHLDAVATDRDRLARYLAHVAADEFAMYVIVGDLVDGTVPPHKFFEARAVRPDVLANMDEYVAYMLEDLVTTLEPLRDTPGILIQGNHDRRSQGTLWSGLAWAVANRLGPNCHYGGDECLVRVRAKNAARKAHCIWTIHCHHGSGGGMYPGGKVNRFQQTVGQLAEADIYVRGHVHDSDCRIMPIYSISRRGELRLLSRPRAFVTTPAFWPCRVEGQNNYASRRGYPPGDEGLIYLEVENPRTERGSGGRIWRHEFPV